MSGGPGGAVRALRCFRCRPESRRSPESAGAAVSRRKGPGAASAPGVQGRPRRATITTRKSQPPTVSKIPNPVNRKNAWRSPS